MMTIDEKLEQAMADYFWAPDDVEVVDRPELGYVHSSRPDVLFNCVFRSRPMKMDPKAMVAEVLSVHPRASRWTINSLSQDDELLAELRAAGYKRGDQHHGYAIHVDEYDRAVRRDINVEQVLTRRHLRDLDGVRNAVFGHAETLSDEDLDRELIECTKPGARVARFVAYLDGVAVGSGGVTAHSKMAFAFLWAGGICEEFRRQGAYTALVRARMDWARTQGITHAGVYAKIDTSAPILAAHGFQRHGHLDNWER